MARFRNCWRSVGVSLFRRGRYFSTMSVPGVFFSVTGFTVFTLCSCHFCPAVSNQRRIQGKSSFPWQHQFAMALPCVARILRQHLFAMVCFFVSLVCFLSSTLKPAIDRNSSARRATGLTLALTSLRMRRTPLSTAWLPLNTRRHHRARASGNAVCDG